MCIDFDKPRYIIALDKPNKYAREFVLAGEFGYPIITGYLSFEGTYQTIEDAQDYIDTMVKFNMWVPQEGLTFDNLKIQEITFNFKDVNT